MGLTQSQPHAGKSSEAKPYRTSFRGAAKVVGGVKIAFENSKRRMLEGSVLTITETAKAWRMLSEGSIPETDELPKTSMRRGDFINVQDRPLREESIDMHVPHIAEDEDVPIQSEELCNICGVYTGREVFPCRVCTRVYHETCLRTNGQCQNQDALKILLRANTDVGWSCCHCENLCNLLTEDEIFSIMDAFQSCDIRDDSVITWDEYIAYRQRTQSDDGLEAHEIENEKYAFHLMDSSKTGKITWFDFVNAESIKVLQQQNKYTLVNLLTTKEIQKMRTSFRTSDIDNDGLITWDDATKGFWNWFSNFYSDAELKLKTSCRAPKTMPEINFTHHVDVHSNLLMEADTNETGTVSWEEFVLDNAIYMLAMRPNMVTLPRLVVENEARKKREKASRAEFCLPSQIDK